MTAFGDRLYLGSAPSPGLVAEHLKFGGMGIGPIGEIWNYITYNGTAPVAAGTNTFVGSSVLAFGTGTYSPTGTVFGTPSADYNAPLNSQQLDYPRTLSFRNIGTNGATNTLVATFVGYDTYRVPMTQTLTHGTAATPATLVTTKAFSVLAYAVVSYTGVSGTGTFAIGVGSGFGLPLRLQSAAQLSNVTWQNGPGTTFGTFTPTLDQGTLQTADPTSPATATTGDVRGVYYPSSAANGTLVLGVRAGISQDQIIASLVPTANSGSGTTVLGVPQV